MGAVWLARLSGKLGFERLDALKTILPQYADDPRFRDMFLDEARLASRIQHANVAQILDIGEDGDSSTSRWSTSTASRCATARSAISQRRRCSSPTRVALRIVADVCAGLHAAHELRGRGRRARSSVVHRDVSPQNVLGRATTGT